MISGIREIGYLPSTINTAENSTTWPSTVLERVQCGSSKIFPVSSPQYMPKDAQAQALAATIWRPLQIEPSHSIIPIAANSITLFFTALERVQCGSSKTNPASSLQYMPKDAQVQELVATTSRPRPTAHSPSTAVPAANEITLSCIDRVRAQFGSCRTTEGNSLQSTTQGTPATGSVATSSSRPMTKPSHLISTAVVWLIT